LLLKKKVPYHLIETLPTILAQQKKQEPSSDFNKASPLGKIPAIKYKNFHLEDSSSIISYLEDKFPKHPLDSKTAEAKSKILWIEKYADEELAKLTHKVLLMEKVFILDFFRKLQMNSKLKKR
jgi:glutathione S-transferase